MKSLSTRRRPLLRVKTNCETDGSFTALDCVSPVEVRELPGVEHARQHEGAGVEGARGGGPPDQRRHRAHHGAHPGVQDAVPGALRRSAIV